MDSNLNRKVATINLIDKLMKWYFTGLIKKTLLYKMNDLPRPYDIVWNKRFKFV